jgi:acetoin utilization protein AcuB
MAKIIEIQSVMTLCPHSIGSDQELSKAQSLMRQHNIRHLPVREGGKLVGIISDRDLKFASGWSKADSTNLTVQDICMPEPYIVEPQTDLRIVLKRMVDDQIGCALVATSPDKLVGIFTTTDACRYLGEVLAK